MSGLMEGSLLVLTEEGEGEAEDELFACFLVCLFTFYMFVYLFICLLSLFV